MTQTNPYGRTFRRADPQTMFAVRFADGTTAYTRVAPKLASFGASPAVHRLVAERQITGEVPPGDILEIIRVR
jgi:hypothetical protein